MKLTHYIYISAALAMLTACGDDDNVSQPESQPQLNYTVGEAINAITLSAGIREGNSGVQTRAGSDDVYVPFSAQTKLRLRVDGTWTGHGSVPYLVSKMTSASTATSASDKLDGEANDMHAVEFTSSEALYWDDYGTADPANAETGRTTGLTIYGVAVEGKPSLPTSAPANLTSESLSWTELPWNVGAVSESKISQKGGWGNYDLITSNNIRPKPTEGEPNGAEGTYKFNDYIHDLKNPSETKQSVNLLKFTHAMTKITVNLTAGEGFPGYDTGAENAKFENAPEVTLLGFNYMGKVNVETKTSTPTATDGTTTTPVTTDIEAWRDNGNAWPTTGGQHTSQFTALVFPGNSFTATIASDGTATSSPNILKLEADGNVYYVTAAQLVKAIVKKENSGAEPAADTYDRSLAQGVNYILNVKVNKTKVIVEATIKAWDEIDADEEAPVINISANYGQTTTTGVGSFDKTYDFFRSTTKASGYDEDNTENGINPAATFTYSGSSYTQNKVLYWPDHNTHYFFRGVYPEIGIASTGLTSSTNLAVTTVNSKDVIAVENVPYTVGTWPSDLAIALPRTTNTPCTNHSKTPLDNGICATKGTITMNFEYAMSKVEVRLKSSENTADDEYVDLSNITVEVVGGYNKGRITLEDGLHDAWDNADKGEYTLNQLTTPATGFTKTTCDAIIPQQLGDDVKFKITVTNANGTDIYYAQLNQIKGKKQGAAEDTKAFITEWKHGEYYIYDLKVTKTVINVTATITDWVTVNASQDVWF